MKRIIYTAVALIFCASVFGIADYLNAKKSGALVNYTDDDQGITAVTTSTKATIPTKEILQAGETKKEGIKKNFVAGRSTRAGNKAVHFAADIPNLAVADKTKDPVIEKIDPLDMLLSKTTIEKVDSSIQKEEKRTIRMEMFSRAPIRIKKSKN